MLSATVALHSDSVRLNCLSLEDPLIEHGRDPDARAKARRAMASGRSTDTFQDFSTKPDLRKS